MKQHASHFRHDMLALLKRRNEAGDILLLAYAALVASLVLSNNYNLAPKLFPLAILPAAFFLHGSVSVKWSWPAARLSVSFANRLVFSLIILAAFVYVLMLTLSSWGQPNFDRRAVDQLWLQSALILLFMLVTAHAVAFVDRFLVRLIAIIVPLIAIGAGLNVVHFLASPLDAAVSELRLVNWLGMPGYTNSTNISLTYAVFFNAAAAVIVSQWTSRRLRLWLAPFAAVLLVAMLLTQSRSAYIGTVIGVGVILSVARDIAFWKKHGRKSAAAVLICVIALGSVSRSERSSRVAEKACVLKSGKPTSAKRQRNRCSATVRWRISISPPATVSSWTNPTT